jgi:predicted transposase/invertase (TIGR01784 family)
MAQDILPPKSDTIFKLLFGDQRNVDILADFLKAVLRIPEDEYREITIVDPHLFPDAPGKKPGIVDLRIKTRSGCIIHVELQLLKIPEMRERLLFYDSMLVIQQIDEGENYRVIQKVISILVTDHVLFPGKTSYHHRFTLYDPRDTTEFTDLLEIHVLEMPKLPPSPDVYLWNWLRFLRAETEEELDMVAQTSPAIQKAVAKVLIYSGDERIRRIHEEEVKARRDRESQIHGAREEGVAQGQQEKARAIARKMLKRNRPVDEIMEDTGLTHEEIEKLRQGRLGEPSLPCEAANRILKTSRLHKYLDCCETAVIG